jgi:hypothetical protein
MTTIINAVASTGLTQTADGSGIVKLQSNGVTTNALAWVNFSGYTGAIRSSYNVSSVTRNAIGDYTINYSTALSDANYSLCLTISKLSISTGNTVLGFINETYPPTTTTARVGTNYVQTTQTGIDCLYYTTIVFGN